jgi:hypothetical protein
MGVAVVGCPIYPQDYGQCYDDYDCPSGEYCNSSGYCDVSSYYNAAGYSGYAGYAGHVPANPEAGADAALPDASASPEAGDAQSTDAVVSDAPAAVVCGNPNDCSATETCGVDGTCHTGTCDAIACVNQFVCAQLTKGLACAPAQAGACAEDIQCAVGSKCVDGACTAPAELCSDWTQCPTGSVCANGKCVVSCATDVQCEPGFRCRTALKICDVAAKECAKASDCSDATLVCVGGACVPRCRASGACGDGKGVCVWNGCVPTQGVVRQCDLDGQTSGCDTGQICLHHRCYTSCETPNETVCATVQGFNVCKPVTTSSGVHAVCGTAENLGSECDPTRGVACAATKVCIDGVCK